MTLKCHRSRKTCCSIVLFGHESLSISHVKIYVFKNCFVLTQHCFLLSFVTVNSCDNTNSELFFIVVTPGGVETCLG